MDFVNKVTLRGFVHQLRKYDWGYHFLVRTEYCYQNKGGERVVENQYHSVKYITKSSCVLIFDKKSINVEGRLRYTKYTSSEGVEQIRTDIIATRVWV